MPNNESPKAPTVRAPEDRSPVAKARRRAARAARQLAIRERRRIVVELRLSGCGYRDIAKHTGTSHVVAWADYNAVLSDDDARTHETLDRHRRTWLLRVERVVRGLWPKLAGGDVRAAEAFAKVLSEAAKLTGAYKPVKIASTSPDGEQWRPMAVTLSAVATPDLLAMFRIASRASRAGDLPPSGLPPLALLTRELGKRPDAGPALAAFAVADVDEQLADPQLADATNQRYLAAQRARLVARDAVVVDVPITAESVATMSTDELGRLRRRLLDGGE